MDDINTFLRGLYPDLRELELTYWPVDAGRYAGLLQRIELVMPENPAALRRELQEQLIEWLTAQSHPEAQCVSVDIVPRQQDFAVDIQIVCR